MHIILASYVIHFCRTKKDTDTQVAKHSFYSPVDFRAVTCFIATMISRPCCLSDTYANASRMKILDVSLGASNSWARKCWLKAECLPSNCEVQRGLESREHLISMVQAISSLFQDVKTPWNCGRAQITQMHCDSDSSVTGKSLWFLFTLCAFWTQNVICRREGICFMTGGRWSSTVSCFIKKFGAVPLQPEHIITSGL